MAGWYWENPQTCREENRHLARLHRDHPDRIFPLASVHPRLGAQAIAVEMDQCREAGFVGVGEIHPTVQGTGLADPGGGPGWELAAAWNWPVLIHITEPVGRDHPGRVETPLQPLLAVLERHPNLRVVLAHWGGLAVFHELNPYIRERFTRVYYDTAASPLLYQSGVWNLALAAAGPGKILFGSDFPLRYRRRSPRADAAALVAEALTELPSADAAAILSGNATALFFPQRLPGDSP